MHCNSSSLNVQNPETKRKKKISIDNKRRGSGLALRFYKNWIDPERELFPMPTKFFDKVPPNMELKLYVKLKTRKNPGVEPYLYSELRRII